MTTLIVAMTLMAVTDPYSTDPTQPHVPYPPQVPFPQQHPPGKPVSPAPYGQAPSSSAPHVIIVPNTNPPTSTMSVLALVFSILGLVTGCCSFGVFGIVAVVCGHIGLRETSNNAKSGHGMAVAGLVMGYIGILPAIFLSIAMVTGSLTHTGTTTTP